MEKFSVILDVVKAIGVVLGMLGAVTLAIYLIAWFTITVANRGDYRSYWAEREHVSLTFKQFVRFYNINPENYELFDFHAVYFFGGGRDYAHLRNGSLNFIPAYSRFEIAFDKGLFELFKYTKWRKRLARKENEEKEAQHRNCYMKLAGQQVESKNR